MNRATTNYRQTRCLGWHVVSGWIVAALLTFPLAMPAVGEETENLIEELIVNATRLPRAIEELTATVSLITAADMDAEMVEDLDDITRYQPGISIRTAQRGGHEGFSIRGIGGNRVLTVIDGVRSNDIYHAGPSSYGRDNIETDQLKSVEFIRGPASALYGADAIGGAVILRSKTPRDYLKSRPTAFNARASLVEANDQTRYGFTAAVQPGNVGLMAIHTRRAFGGRDVSGPGSLNPQDGQSDSTLLQLFWDMSPSQRWRVSMDSFSEEVATQLGSDLDRTVSKSLGEDETKRLRLGVHYHWEAGISLLDDLEVDVNKQIMDATQYTEQTRTSYSFISPTDPRTFSGTTALRESTFDFDQQTLSLNINVRKTIAFGPLIQSLAYGASLEETATRRHRNRCEEALSGGQVTCRIAAYPFAPPEVFPNKTIPATSTTRFGVYLQDEIDFAEQRLTLIPGVRYDRCRMDAAPDPSVDGTGQVESYGFPIESIDEGALSLSLGVLYDIGGNWSLFGQYAEGYRPPNFAEANQSFVNLGYQYASVPNPKLKAENSLGVELGIRGSIANTSLNLVTYRNRYRNFIETAFAGMRGSISLFQNRNIGEVMIRGMEFNARIVLNTQWQASAAVAYSHGDNLSASTPLDSVDPLTNMVSLSYDAPSGRWGGELILTAVGEKDRVASPEIVNAASYRVVDVLGNYDLSESVRVRFGLFNVFDETYARWINISSLNAESTTAIENAQQPGMNFRVALQIEI